MALWISCVIRLLRRLRVWWSRRRAAPRFGGQLETAWAAAWAALPALAVLDAQEHQRLQELAMRFLRAKTLEPVQGLVLTPTMARMLALQACLPILELGLDWYSGWYAVILYPDGFVPRHETLDEDGLVWVDEGVRSGESWEQGPVILSWADIQADAEAPGPNVILHEMAHKLDGCSGATNGCPPLHAGMSGAVWKQTFTAAFDGLRHRLDQGEPPPIDPYAAESPAEFFAVASEAFFGDPERLEAFAPGVYAQLRAFYRQDPLLRQQRLSG